MEALVAAGQAPGIVALNLFALAQVDDDLFDHGRDQ